MDDQFEVEEIAARRRAAGAPWLEFLRGRFLSMGLYELPAAGDDRQRPHTEDEVYYIVRGRGRLRIGGTDHAIRPGSILFVPAGVEHRFHGLTEELTALVVFAPPEGSRAAGPAGPV